MRRLRVRVRGLVQGVGFRPFVYALATRFDLVGWVQNDEQGVLLEVQGERCDAFLSALSADAPPLARIDEAVVDSLAPKADPEGRFEIQKSARLGTASSAIGPDAAVCEACLEEMFDVDERRYLYPFLSCTHCGPRFTITRSLPYDRPQTSMAVFPMCALCLREYENPNDRRFHAQPIACPTCGPKLSHPVGDVVRSLLAGRIVALKGIGGFHLICDAKRGEAVRRLRQRKDREAKPLAVMVLNATSAERLGRVGGVERALLTSAARPIVLLERHDALPPDVAPDLAALGVMLPYAPVHYLLFHEWLGRPTGKTWLARACDVVLVMTSANPGGEPLVTENDEARERLRGIADDIITHDRAIVVRADDTVMRVVGGAPGFVRRGRGRVPEPIELGKNVPCVAALGAHLKNTVCVTRGTQAFVSQHIGDLDNGAVLDFLEEVLAHLLGTLEVSPVVVAHDAHPDYLTTQLAASFGLPTLGVQHHHAHVAAVMAEHRVDTPIVGLALDGFGLGTDGGAWGGELLRVDGGAFQRLGHLRPLRMPGGDLAARQPWRMAAAALHAMGRSHEIAERFGRCGASETFVQALSRDALAPWTSSCGRLFDAACGLLGVKLHAAYEGEAPAALESLVQKPRVVDGAYHVDHGELDLLPLLETISTMKAPDGADAFHGTLAQALVEWTVPALVSRKVVVSGGCMLNRVLHELLLAGFARAGVEVLFARQVPPNDGGLSLGQAWVAAHAVTASS